MKFPMFDVHDQPDQNVTAERRNVSTVPTQALTLLNNEFVLLQSRYLAERLVREAGADPAAQVKLLYRITLGRQPTEKELTGDLQFLRREKELSGGDSPLTHLAHVMLNVNEFVYIN